MALLWRYRRCLPGVVVVCLSLGCGTTTPPPGRSTGNNLALTPAEDRRAQALAHYATAVSLAMTENATLALPEYRQAFDLDPANSALALWLAEMYRSRRDMTNALAVLDLATQANPTSGEPWVARGLTYRSNDDTTNAIASFQQALKLDPAHFGAVRALTEVYLFANDTNNVVALLDHSFRQKATDVNYWITLGDVHLLVIRQLPSLAPRLDRTRARQCYERALALTPNNPDLLARLGDAYMDENNFKAAADAYAKLIEIRPNIPQLRERLAAIYLKTEQRDKAIALYKELMKRDPLRFEFYNVLGELHEDAKKPAAALDYFEQSLKLNPDQSEVYLAVAELQRRLKQDAAVAQTLAAWKKKFPTDWRIPYFSTFYHNEKKDYAKALAAFADAETLAREAPQEVTLSAQFYFAYGAAYERTGDLDKAALLFGKSIAANPKLANAYNYLGYMWADKGTNLTEALANIQKAVELEPDNGAYQDSLGWVKYKLGKPAEALPALLRAIELLEKDTQREPEDRLEDAVVYDHLAEVQLKLGQTAAAIQTWKRALAIDPGNKDIAAKLQQHSASSP
ncbi:MAG: tetratricopeptide repeat protein [Verrucomicrobiota bacterium]